MNKIQEFLSKPGVVERFNACDEVEEVKLVAKEYETDLTDAEAQKIIDKKKASLPDENLEGIVGGIWGQPHYSDYTTPVSNEPLICPYCGNPWVSCTCGW